MKKNHKTCVYHYPYKDQKGDPECLPPDSDRAIPIECDKCSFHLSFQDRKTIEKISISIMSGYYLPEKEFPDYSGLAILYENLHLKQTFEGYKQRFFLDAIKQSEAEGSEISYMTKGQIEKAVRDYSKSIDINPHLNAEIQSARHINQVVLDHVKESKGKLSADAISAINEILLQLKEKILQIEDLDTVNQYRQTLGRPLEQHAHEVATLRMVWHRSRRLPEVISEGMNPEDYEYYWPSMDVMMKALGGQSLYEMSGMFLKMGRWFSRADFYHRLSSQTRNG